MPFLARAFASPSGRLVNRSWLHPRVRASAIDLEGFLYNAPALPHPGDDCRAYVHFVVEGRLHLVRSGVTIGPNQALIVPSIATTFDEGMVVQGPHRGIAVRVDARVDDLAIIDTPVVDEHHARLARTKREHEALLLSIDLLRLARLSSTFDRAPLPRRDWRVAAALSHALTRSTALPALVDLDGARLSDRQLRRDIHGFFDRYRMPFAGWRDLQRSFTLTFACVALTAPGARTEDVSEAVGYGSPTGLCHALHRAGLGSPQSIARTTAELRRNL